jgi:SAM-dependent methyltransferase
MLANLEYKLLCKFWPLEQANNVPDGEAKLTHYLNPFLSRLEGLDVLDFGCGDGCETLALAPTVRSIVGLDINPQYIANATRKVEKLSLGNITFATEIPNGRTFDAIISLDAFEHFEDPPAILKLMYSVLRPNGVLLASFGPTWYHPYGGHMFSVFPWAHLVLDEKALVQWRNQFRANKARHMKEGLNWWSIGRFEKMVNESPLTVKEFQCIPISSLRPIHCRITREFTTSVVQMRLTRL